LVLTGADLEVLCKEAALHSVKPFYKELVNMNEDSKDERSLETKKHELISQIVVTKEDFDYAIKQVEPSAMREVLIKKPNVRWSDIGGLDSAKEKLRELVELPLLRPDLFVQAGITPSKGILLSGPPGTGKTLLAKAVATESNANFISVKGPELISKWVGESEKHIREIFKKARQVAPTIIFFDEFDSISKARGSSISDATEKVVNQLLTELDGVEELEKVVVIAATNRKDLIDSALLRPGRIESIVELGIPDEKTREEIFKVQTRKMPLAKDIDLKIYSKNSDGWTGAEIEGVVREAGMQAIKRHYSGKSKEEFKVTKEDFDFAFENIVKSSMKGKSLKKESSDKDEKVVKEKKKS
jgi:transitional endoplasmic reticulum ATPase